MAMGNSGFFIWWKTSSCMLSTCTSVPATCLPFREAPLNSSSPSAMLPDPSNQFTLNPLKQVCFHL